jgi:hypothetical protein
MHQQRYTFTTREIWNVLVEREVYGSTKTDAELELEVIEPTNYKNFEVLNRDLEKIVECEG